MKSLVLVLIHLSAPRLRKWLKPRDVFINAFGGGMAISYVFIHLLPEIGEGKEHLGVYTFIITLVGYVLFSFLNRSRHAAEQDIPKIYRFSILQGWLYSFILIVGLPQDYSQSHLHIMLMTFAAALHVIHTDYELVTEFGKSFKLNGRYVLATAPVFGILARWFLFSDSDILVHAITSILAGVMIYSIARKDVPIKSRFSLVWFILGIICYTGLLLLIDSL